MRTIHTIIAHEPHIHKKFEINRTKIKGTCQSGRKVETHDSKSDLPLASTMDVMQSRFSVYTNFSVSASTF